MAVKQGEKQTLSAQCRICGEVHELKVYIEDFARWRNGEVIQNAMPYLTPGERELLISGTCDKCFHQMFGF